MLSKLKKELSKKELLSIEKKKVDLKIDCKMDNDLISDIISDKLLNMIKKNIC